MRYSGQAGEKYTGERQTVLYWNLKYYIVLLCTFRYQTAPVLYSTVLLLYCTSLYCSVLHYTVSITSAGCARGSRWWISHGGVIRNMGWRENVHILQVTAQVGRSWHFRAVVELSLGDQLYQCLWSPNSWFCFKPIWLTRTKKDWVDPLNIYCRAHGIISCYLMNDSSLQCCCKQNLHIYCTNQVRERNSKQSVPLNEGPAVQCCSAVQCHSRKAIPVKC